MILLRAGDHGCDVSGWQREPIDWAKTGLDFAIIKATEGARHVSNGWKVHAYDVRGAGMVFGAYHFLHLDAPIQAQAELFADVLTLRGPVPDFVALDVEWSRRHDPKIKPRLRVKRVTQWLRAVEDSLGLPSIIYTQASYYRGRLASHPGLRRWPLWQAGRHEVPGWPATIVQRVERVSWYGGRKVDLDEARQDWEVPDAC